jgi:hypothetical protein
MEIMLFVAVFSGLVSAPFAVFIDWIIHKILAAPEINELLMLNLGKEKEISSKTNQFMTVLPVTMGTTLLFGAVLHFHSIHSKEHYFLVVIPQ